MNPPDSLPPRPTPARNLGFWLAAMLIGTVLLFPASFLYAITSGKGEAGLGMLPVIALLSIGFSVAALPLLLPVLPWALTARSALWRLGRLTLLLLIVLTYVLPGGEGLGAITGI